MVSKMQEAVSHDNAKNSNVVWLGDKGMILTAGFDMVCAFYLYLIKILYSLNSKVSLNVTWYRVNLFTCQVISKLNHRQPTRIQQHYCLMNTKFISLVYPWT